MALLMHNTGIGAVFVCATLSI